DPLSLIGKMNLAMTLFCAKDFAAAEIHFRSVLEIDDNVAGSHWMLSRTLWQMGRKDEAMNEIFLGLKKDGNEILAERVRAISASSTHEEAIRFLLHEWRAVPPETNNLNMAYLTTYVNDSDKAVYWLEKSFDERHPWTAWISAYPEFESLYNKPGYQKLLQQMNMTY
ncbi:MAG: tetratricopeptide repeat protein, partial [Saprospiraceae bacterium]|nr:tetratricopeptide repeat protein [Pyrinomonadaceae bacterium]